MEWSIELTGHLQLAGLLLFIQPRIPVVSFQSVQYPNCDGALGYGLIISLEHLFAVFHLSDVSQLMHELIIVKRGTSLLRG